MNNVMSALNWGPFLGGDAALLAALLVLLLVVPKVVKTRWRLMAALWLSLFQVYLAPIHGVYLSLAFICALMLWPEAIKQCRTLLAWWPSRLVIALLAVQTLSLCWSSDLSQGVRVVAFTLPFLTVLAATVAVVGEQEDMARVLLEGMIACALVEALLVVVMHLVPRWEAWFISSRIARVFISPNSFSTGNMQVPNWSGVLINPNAAAGYLGMSSFVAMATAVHYRSWWTGLVGGLLAVAVWFTGSEAGIILMFLLYGIWGAVLTCRVKDIRLRRWGACLLVCCGVLALWLGNPAAARGSFDVRWRIWQYAVPAFREHPLMGLGFGGWQEFFPAYAAKAGVPSRFPPHNTLIYLWSQSGMFAVVLGVGFMASVLLEVWRMRTVRSWRFFVAPSGLALLWYFTQQMGTNWGLLQERHMVPLVALLLGIVHTVNRRNDAKI